MSGLAFLGGLAEGATGGYMAKKKLRREQRQDQREEQRAAREKTEFDWKQRHEEDRKTLQEVMGTYAAGIYGTQTGMPSEEQEIAELERLRQQGAQRVQAAGLSGMQQPPLQDPPTGYITRAGGLRALGDPETGFKSMVDDLMRRGRPDLVAKAVMSPEGQQMYGMYYQQMQRRGAPALARFQTTKDPQALRELYAMLPDGRELGKADYNEKSDTWTLEFTDGQTRKVTTGNLVQGAALALQKPEAALGYVLERMKAEHKASVEAQKFGRQMEKERTMADYRHGLAERSKDPHNNPRAWRAARAKVAGEKHPLPGRPLYATADEVIAETIRRYGPRAEHIEQWAEHLAETPTEGDEFLAELRGLGLGGPDIARVIERAGAIAEWPRVKTPAEISKLKPGQYFVDPSGVVRQR